MLPEPSSLTIYLYCFVVSCRYISAGSVSIHVYLTYFKTSIFNTVVSRLISKVNTISIELLNSQKPEKLFSLFFFCST